MIVRATGGALAGFSVGSSSAIAFPSAFSTSSRASAVESLVELDVGSAFSGKIRLSSISSCPRGLLMRNIPQGEKMLTPGSFSSDWRIGAVNRHSLSTSRRPLRHEVCKETFLTSMLPLHDAGLI